MRARALHSRCRRNQLTGGLEFGELAAKESILDSILHASDDALNANPLRQLIPVDWAEVARALRTVWLRSVSRPDRAMAAAADFNMVQGQSWVDTWNDAWRRWCGLARPEPAPSGGADKRFAAPEWQSNPVYHTLKELYLIASDWLLRQASEPALDVPEPAPIAEAADYRERYAMLTGQRIDLCPCCGGWTASAIIGRRDGKSRFCLSPSRANSNILCGLKRGTFAARAGFGAMCAYGTA